MQAFKVRSSATVNQTVHKLSDNNSAFTHTPTFKSAASAEVSWFGGIISVWTKSLPAPVQV